MVSETKTEGRSLERLAVLNTAIVDCRRCPRLVAHREEVGRVKRRAYLNEDYWSRPVPGFGDLNARLLIVGLAPGAHGANRTGRMFTGDRSGEFLYRALYQTGFANQPQSTSREDGLKLKDVYITAPVRCVPPDNKPAREEILACRPYLVEEFGILGQVKVVLALGSIGFDSYLAMLQDQSLVPSRSALKFRHGGIYDTHASGPKLLASYHPSQQNTLTGRLTAEMLRTVFETARQLVDAD